MSNPGYDPSMVSLNSGIFTTLSISDELTNSLKNQNNWEVQLIGHDGPVIVDAIPLLLFSPLLRRVLLSDGCRRNVPTKILLPDFGVSTLISVGKFVTCGSVVTLESDLLELTNAISTLELDSGFRRFSILQAPQTQSIQKKIQDKNVHSTTSKKTVSNTLSIKSNATPTRNTTPTPTHPQKRDNNNSTATKSQTKISLLKNTTPTSWKETLMCNICSAVFDTCEQKVNHDCIVDNMTSTFSCSICKKVYGEKCVAIVHQTLHSVEGLKECILCQRQFSSVLRLLAHVRRHTGECKQISSVENSNKSFVATTPKSGFKVMPRTEIKLDKTVVESSVTDTKSMDISFFKNGMISANSDGRFPCTKCNRIFKTSFRLFVHDHFHSGGVENQCPICKATFKDVFSCVQHVKHGHFKTEEFRVSKERKFFIKRSFACQICQMKFPTRIGSIIHKSKVHAKKFKCKNCTRQFGNSQSLEIHMNSHTGTDYECRKCNLQVNNKFELFRHRRICGVEMKENSSEYVKRKINKFVYDCSLCPRQFRFRKSFLKHQEKHKNTERFVKQKETSIEKSNKKVIYDCTVCQRKFQFRKSFLRHQEKHKSAVQDELDKSSTENVPGENELTVKRKSLNVLHGCGICDKPFHFRKTLLLHQKNHRAISMKHELVGKTAANGEKKVKKVLFDCTVCQRQFKFRKSFLCHIENHRNDVRSVKQELKRSSAEDQNVNINREVYNCKVCQRQFHFYKSFLRHEESHRIVLRSAYQEFSYGRRACKQCNKTFSGLTELQKHKKTCQVEASKKLQKKYLFSCSNCSSKFTRKWLLKLHMKRHKSSNNVFKYLLHTKNFQAEKQFKLHSKTHGKSYNNMKKTYSPKTHKCRNCTKAFCTKSRLLLHSQKHRGKNETICPICNMESPNIKCAQYHVHKFHGSSV